MQLQMIIGENSYDHLVFCVREFEHAKIYSFVFSFFLFFKKDFNYWNLTMYLCNHYHQTNNIY